MFLQDVTALPVDTTAECLGYGALISLLVSMLKGVPFIKKNPKTVSAILSILWVAIPAFIRGGADFKIIAFCVLTQFSGSVAFYEAGTRQIRKVTGPPQEEPFRKA